MPQNPDQSPPHQRGPAGTPVNGDAEPQGFLQRWSQRKADAAKGNEAASTPEPPEQQQATVEPSPQKEPTTEEAPPQVTEADLENLTYDSDYTKFMGEHVPEAIRRRALRQLWRSDPILANLDGLCDYDDDYTDAALAVKVLKTAHKIGQGYLTDEEVAANRARGKTDEADTETLATDDSEEIGEGEDFDDAEDIEDFEDDTDEPITTNASSTEPSEPTEQS